MHAEVQEIRRKLATSPWPKFLNSVTISGLRGWSGQEVRFPFPVTVIAGENGSGKSTVLKAATVAYADPRGRDQTFFPDVFFPDTAWDRVSGVTLTYSVTEGNRTRPYSIRKPTERWRFPSRATRETVFQDISRTLPIDATAGYARIAKRRSAEASARALDRNLALYYSAILGRQYVQVRIARSSLDVTRDVGVVRLATHEFSQFHQGAGEDATLDLMMLLQNVPDTALVVIDEVEASLHPRSQRRLIHFLLWLARTKHIQVILSTHSPYVLEEVPFEARVFLQRQAHALDVIYGTTTNFALNRMDDVNTPDLCVFVEDEHASTLASELLRHEGIDLGRIRVMEAGAANVVATLGQLAANNRLPARSLCVLDADQAAAPGCTLLPGTCAPERQLVEDIRRSHLAHLAVRLGMGEPSVEDALSRASTLPDHHDWIPHAARTLSQTPAYLWTTLCQVWIRHALTDAQREAFCTPFADCLR